MIYLEIIAISTALYYISEKCKNKNIRRILIILSVLITAVFSGVRSYETGTDIKTYVLYHFDIAKHSSLLSYVRLKGADSILYSIMIVFVAHVFPNAHWMLFFIQLYINVFFYIAAYKYNLYSHKSGTLFLLVYYCTFYIYTFNIMRQGMAVAMIVLACVELIYKKNYKLYFFMNIMAFLMHPTAIICFIIPILMKLFCDPRDLSKKTFSVSAIILSITVILVLQFQRVIEGLVALGIVKERYLYSATTLLKSKADFETYKLLFCMLMLLITLGICKKEYMVVKELTITFLMISFAAYLVGGVSTFTERIGLYFWMAGLCVSSGYVVHNSFKLKCGTVELTESIYILFMIAMCVFQFFVCNQAAAYPYAHM